ncbi:Bug family tripartite tricarboxylate transporter substrate binding protein [Pigmentiphaga litoralis]|uniref:Bug family tripartite tricarboxylate transporter substrate binding protein n=1 Tax=Pigmentiphaga litoralis TaxID=516702 RepID=UPI003899B238
MNKPRSSLRRLMLAAALASPVASFAQLPYPNKPIRIVNPFPPGGSADVLARVIGEKLQDSLKQPVVVESRPGGNTLIAAGYVANSAPDGYTLMIAIDFTLTLTKALYRQLPFDPDRDFAPVSLLTTQPLLLLSNPRKMSVKSVPEMIAYAKANGDKMNVGVGAVVSQLVWEAMKGSAQVQGELISYRGSQPTTTALLAGDINLSIDAPLTNLPFIKEGRIAPLAVTSRVRMPSLPETPTVGELGLPGMEMLSMFCLVAPARTPQDVLLKLNQEMRRIMALPDVQAKLSEYALTATSSTPEELQGMLKAFSERWSPVVRRANIRLD